jgi:hypothetical protein
LLCLPRSQASARWTEKYSRGIAGCRPVQIGLAVWIAAQRNITVPHLLLVPGTFGIGIDITAWGDLEPGRERTIPRHRDRIARSPKAEGALMAVTLGDKDIYLRRLPWRQGTACLAKIQPMQFAVDRPVDIALRTRSSCQGRSTDPTITIIRTVSTRTKLRRADRH